MSEMICKRMRLDLFSPSLCYLRCPVQRLFKRFNFQCFSFCFAHFANEHQIADIADKRHPKIVAIRLRQGNNQRGIYAA